MLKKNRSYTVILFLLLFPASFFSQNQYDMNRFFDEGKDYYSNFTNWETEDYLKLTLLAGATYGLMHLDDDIKKEVLKPKWFDGNAITLFGRFYGEPVTPLILGSALLIHGNSNGNAANKRLGFEILQAGAYAMTLTTILKYIFGRERPFTASNAFEFHPLSFRNNDFLSFPSGHTTIAFSISTVLAENAHSKFWEILSYLPAVLTGFSRIYEDRHWASDVLLGAAIGYFSGRFFTKLHRENKFQLNEKPKEIFKVAIPLN